MKIGLLPLFIQLYDKATGRSPARDVLEPYYDEIAGKLTAKGLEVVKVPFCCVRSEFADAVAKFEAEKVDAIVTLHAAYSPSLESIDALAGTKLPIIVCDTTVCPGFGPDQPTPDIMYCHGIHGVMDMCSLLIQRGKPFAIAAGHADESDVLDRVVGFVKAACAAESFRGSAVGTIGGSFDGMGDFLIAPEDMKKIFDIDVFTATQDELEALRATITEDEIKAEYEMILTHFAGADKIAFEDYRPTIVSGLATRKWIAAHGLDAFTVNFLNVGRKKGMPTMPFMEACLEMEKGVGYAGEGDILTAAVTGALMRGFGKDKASFVEIFCPDWRGNTLLLSHMGEINLNLTQKPATLTKFDFIYGDDSEDPVIPFAAYKGGKAVYVNICKDAEKYNMVITPVEMQNVDNEQYFDKIRGWMKPCMPVGQFLEGISRNGATHHSSIVYDATPEQIEFFAKLIGVNPVILK